MTMKRREFTSRQVDGKYVTHVTEISEFNVLNTPHREDDGETTEKSDILPGAYRINALRFLGDLHEGELYGIVEGPQTIAVYYKEKPRYRGD